MEKTKPSVKIVEICKVAPLPVETLDSVTPKSLPLTFFDMRWLTFVPVQSLYFYDILSTSNTDSSTTALFQFDILPKLKKSLSLALHHFLPIAGNLIWPESSDVPVLDYAEGDGVSLTVAESDADFQRLSGTNELFEATEYHPLVSNLETSRERASVLTLQITLFPSSGFSIGITAHHATFDGRTLVLFMKSWAHICRRLGGHNTHDILHDHRSSSLPPELKPFYDRSTVVMNLANLQTDSPDQDRSLMRFRETKEVPADSVRGTFQLTRTKIEKLRQMVNQQHDQNELRASTFSLTYAYSLCCLVKAEGLTANDKVVVVFAVDCRSLLEPPLPATYFGNCVMGNGVVLETKSLLGREGLGAAVKAIGETIKSLKTDGVVNKAEKQKSGIASSISIESASRMYSVAGSPQFEAYSVDFGWGRPRKKDVVSIDRTGAIHLAESRNGDGVEIGLALKRRHMEAFSALFAQGLDSSEMTLVRRRISTRL